MKLGQELKARYLLDLCEVAPASVEQSAEEVFQSLCVLGAQVMERFIRSEEPCTFALGVGRQFVAASTTLKNFSATITALLLWLVLPHPKAILANLI